MTKTALIFDLDGTLWNATGPAYEALVDLQKELHLPLSSYELFCSLMGQPMDVIAAKVLPQLSEKERETLMAKYYKRELAYIRRDKGELFPHMVDILQELKEEHPLFIVSNCQRGYIETFLSTHKLEELFVDHLCWGDTKNSKGQNIRSLMTKHAVEKAVYIGDTLGDELAAKKASIPFIYVDFGFGQAKDPLYRISSFLELPPLVKETAI